MTTNPAYRFLVTIFLAAVISIAHFQCTKDLYVPKAFEGPIHEFVLGKWHITAVKGWPYDYENWTQVSWDRTLFFKSDSIAIIQDGPELHEHNYEIDDELQRLYFFPQGVIPVYYNIEMEYDHVMVLSQQTRDGLFSEQYIRME